MLYLVGGASRSGKTMLARKLLTEEGVAYFPLDALMMGIVNSHPGFGLDPETSSIVRGERLWPILRAMAVNLLEERLYHPDYLLEGDELLPKYIAELAGEKYGHVFSAIQGLSRRRNCRPSGNLNPSGEGFVMTMASYWPSWLGRRSSVVISSRNVPRTN